MTETLETKKKERIFSIHCGSKAKGIVHVRDEKSDFIVIFRPFLIAIAQFSALFYRQFDERLRLFERTATGVPAEEKRLSHP